MERRATAVMTADRRIRIVNRRLAGKNEAVFAIPVYNWVLLIRCLLLCVLLLIPFNAIIDYH